VEIVHAGPRNCFEPPMLEGVRILPPPKKTTTDSRQITSQRCMGKIIDWNGLPNAFIGTPSRGGNEPQSIPLLN